VGWTSSRSMTRPSTRTDPKHYRIRKPWSDPGLTQPPPSSPSLPFSKPPRAQRGTRVQGLGARGPGVFARGGDEGGVGGDEK
jgi:hypothetical protein